MWSSKTTWTDQEFPKDDDMVIVPPGQAIMVDQDTPKIKMLLVQGILAFAGSRDVHLRAEYISVQGGVFEVGVPGRPHRGRAVITLHGDKYAAVRLPVVGAKVHLMIWSVLCGYLCVLLM